VQYGIQQHGAVTIRHDKTIAVDPVRVGRIVPHKVVPEHFGDIGHAHGRAGMTGLRPFHGVHAQGADGVGQYAALRCNVGRYGF
jgi:hypothetical protein